MVKSVLGREDGVHWLDVVQPSTEELAQIARKYDLHPRSVQDCLDPEHLPKFERIGALSFAILRAYDDAAADEADTIQELTRKTAVFFTDRFLITIHRQDQSFMGALRDRWREQGPQADARWTSQIFAELLGGAVATYERPIDRALDDLERMEMGVFEAQGAQPFDIKQGYFLKRKASVFKRMLRLTSDLLPKLAGSVEIDAPHAQDIRDRLDSSLLYAEELTESVTSLLSLHISLASQRTNEVMRVLTVFSVFLLPLNVITGIYGMNFEHMPELKWPHGYPLAITSMGVVLGVVYFWFRRRGWLK